MGCRGKVCLQCASGNPEMSGKSDRKVQNVDLKIPTDRSGKTWEVIPARHACCIILSVQIEVGVMGQIPSEAGSPGLA